MSKRNLLTFLFASLVAISPLAAADSKNPVVTLSTNKGDIKIELFKEQAPLTVENFIQYVKAGYYEDTIFHRVIPNFMIQGGGFTSDMKRKATRQPIQNEANAFLPNLRGTISMARTNDPHSATSQFFINTVNNKSLNKSSFNPGYAVFGKVIEGMPVVDSISGTATGFKSGMRDVPTHNIIIHSTSLSTDTQ